jgi:hypothetical protein
MVEVKYKIKDEIARRWERILKAEFAQNLGDKVTEMSLDELMN